MLAVTEFVAIADMDDGCDVDGNSLHYGDDGDDDPYCSGRCSGRSLRTISAYTLDSDHSP